MLFAHLLYSIIELDYFSTHIQFSLIFIIDAFTFVIVSFFVDKQNAKGGSRYEGIFVFSSMNISYQVYVCYCPTTFTFFFLKYTFFLAFDMWQRAAPFRLQIHHSYYHYISCSVFCLMYELGRARNPGLTNIATHRSIFGVRT